MKQIVFALLFALSSIIPVAGQSFNRNIGIKQADKLIRDHEFKGDLVILDVRTPGEFAERHIKGAININYWDKGFIDSISVFDRTRIYLVYCTSGVRSGGAMKKMRRLGFEKICNMKKGMFGWRAARLPLIEKPGKSPLTS